MKKVLISIRPKWCELIASGEKTIEVRKTTPKLETPFKCYIYCTQGDGTLNDTLMTNDRRFVLNQKVIGEFVCDRIDEYNQLEHIVKFNYLGLPDEYNKGYVFFVDDLKKMCLTYDEITTYGKGKTLYGWHLKNLVVYDKPKALSEFGLERPPQSWCYVEEGK